MVVFNLLILSVSVSFISCGLTNAPQKCSQNYTTLDNEVIDIKQCNSEQKCIAKCCPKGEIFVLSRKNHTMSCTVRNETNYDSLFYIYKNNIEQAVARSNQTIKDYKFVHSKRFDLNNSLECFGFVEIPKDTYFILEDGSLRTRTPHFYYQYKYGKKSLEYCIDIVKVSKTKLKAGYILQLDSENFDTSVDQISNYKAYMMLISCFFLLLVFIVYCLLPTLRNIGGMVLMAYIASVMAAYFLQAMHNIFIDVITQDDNKIYTPFLYFALLSMFFWMNILSFDIWWTFRGTRKCREIHRRGELVKFGWYSLYAWGMPALMTTGAVVIDNVNLSKWPYFVKPHFESCLFYVPETVLYLHIPIFTLIIASFILFLMTAYNIWRTDRAFLAIDSRRGSLMSTNNKKRLRVYLCLSMLMGGSWFLELLNIMIDYDNMAVYILLTFLNLLIGVVIFFVYVFKKNILIMLLKRFKINHPTLNRDENQTSTNYSHDSKKSKNTGSVRSNNDTANTYI